MERVLGRFAPHIYALLRIVAGIIELVGGLLIAIGLVASIAAFISSGEMAAAYFMAHAPKAPLPIENGGELAALYCFLFLYIAARGPGVWAVERAARPGAAPR